jgi:oligopeptide/dipeptide ABC transporter ATP-binding protein
MTALLSVRALSVSAGPFAVVRNVDFDVEAGETLGIIGESGSGKTVTCLALLRLLPSALHARADALLFKGSELSALSDGQFRALRGRALAIMFQDPVGAFNPAKRIGWHLRTVFRRRGSGGLWRAAAHDALDEVGIPHPDSVLARFPHQLSGGMLQRVLIAMVLMLEPDLIIADEPTTNLDNIVEQQILDLFAAIQARLKSAFVFITHDMTVAERVCDRIAVMYAGEIVETGRTREVLAAPAHPYTQGLIATSNALHTQAETLAEIPGQLPALDALLPGCVFSPRCADVRAGCAARQALRHVRDDRFARCLLYD